MLCFDNAYQTTFASKSRSQTAKITIPAVKITGDTAAVPALPSLPDPVVSSTTDDQDLLKVALEDDPVLEDLLPLDGTDGVLPEDEFGDFLLDVVDWL